MRKHIVATACVTMVMGLGGVMAASAGARQIIKVENGNRVETNLDSSSENGPGYAGEAASGDAAGDTGIGVAADMVKLQGTLNEVMDGSFSMNRQFENGYQEEVIVHVDPEQTLILDGVNGFPADLSSVQPGSSIYAYVGPAMTLSIPPQMSAVMVLVDIPQDAAAPEYVTAAGALTEDGQGGYQLTTTDGSLIPVPADCQIIPYLTRQMVRLSDITEGRRCLVWLGADGIAQKIVLFNE
ncbi:MAG: hypothetical protein Q4E86_12125 [Lachnospiraceae bacterium]|nr:hypothetical protein [Lachnospiraceae bacterium]